MRRPRSPLAWLVLALALLAATATSALADPPPATGTVNTVRSGPIPLREFGPGSYITIVSDPQGRIRWNPSRGATSACGAWIPNTTEVRRGHTTIAARLVLDTNPSASPTLVNNPDAGINGAFRGLRGGGIFNDPVNGWTFHDKSDSINNLSQGANAEMTTMGDPRRLGPNGRAEMLSAIRANTQGAPIIDVGMFEVHKRIEQLKADGVLDQSGRCPARQALRCTTRYATAGALALRRTRNVAAMIGQQNPGVLGGQLQILASQGQAMLILSQAMLAVAQTVDNDNAMRRMAVLNRNAAALRTAYSAWLYSPASGIAAEISPMPGRTEASIDNAIQNIGSGYIAYFFTADEIRAAQESGDPMAFTSLQYQAFELYFSSRFAQETNWTAPCSMTRHRTRLTLFDIIFGTGRFNPEFNDIVCRQPDGSQVVYVNNGRCNGRLSFSETPMPWAQYLALMARTNNEWNYDHRYDTEITPAPAVSMPWRNVPRVPMDRFTVPEDAVWRAMANLGLDQGAACTIDVTGIEVATTGTGDTGGGVCCIDASCSTVMTAAVQWPNGDTQPGPGTSPGTGGTTTTAGTPPTPPSDVYTAQRALAGSYYYDILNRTATESDLAWATGVVATQGSAVLARTVLGSLEARYVVINKLYLTAFGRTADSAGLNYWASVIAPGDPLPAVVGILGSQEYFNRQGNTNAGFVVGLYRDLLGRTASPPEISYWASIAASSRASVISGFAYSPEYRARIISGWYQTYLNRTASAADIAFWSQQLAANPVWREHQVGFLASPEYAQLHRY